MPFSLCMCEIVSFVRMECEAKPTFKLTLILKEKIKKEKSNRKKRERERKRNKERETIILTKKKNLEKKKQIKSLIKKGKRLNKKKREEKDEYQMISHKVRVFFEVNFLQCHSFKTFLSIGSNKLWSGHHPTSSLRAKLSSENHCLSKKNFFYWRKKISICFLEEGSYRNAVFLYLFIFH